MSNRKYDEYAGVVLKQLRTARGFTQQKLADEIGISFQQIQKYEKGVNSMNIGMCSRVSYALGISPSLFFDIDSSELGDVEADVGIMKLYSKLTKQEQSAIREIMKLLLAHKEQE